MSERNSEFEIVNGRTQELPSRSVLACVTVSQITGELNRHVRCNNLGFVVANTLFTIDAQSANRRRPSAAFVSFDRWPVPTLPNTDPWEVVPDFAIEVVSPSNSAKEIDAKIVDFFRSGVRLTWIVYPDSARFHIYTSADQMSVVNRDGELTGGNVLPEFKVKVADLYRGMTKPNPQ